MKLKKLRNNIYNKIIIINNTSMTIANSSKSYVNESFLNLKNALKL